MSDELLNGLEELRRELPWGKTQIVWQAIEHIAKLETESEWHKWPEEAPTFLFDNLDHYLCVGSDDDEVFLLPDPALCIEREWMAVEYFKMWANDPRDDDAG